MKTSHDRLPRLAGTLVYLAALWSFPSIPFARDGSLSVVDDVFGALGIPAGPNLFLALSLLIVGAALRRGLRIAWVVSLSVLVLELLVYALSSILVITDALEGDIELLDGVFLAVGTTVTTVWIALFVLYRRDFPARMRRGAMRKGC
ncbi:hypothetical protein [Kocuria tytonis]|uniref:hypothetical protein n=1 Tax=Kocuria tytonis TaxID=2054280 RepID=UPI001F2743BD|nr:hypothetical protein [Kocuria tytonis]